MRAAVYAGNGGVDVIALRDVAEPELGTDDVLVSVAFAGLNRADILEREGRYGGGRTGELVPGLEYSGTVDAVGPRVTTRKPNDRVCGLVASGAHAERLVAHEGTASPVPDGVSLEVAAALPEAFITAYDALFTHGGLRLGQNVLVHAVGSGVGLAAIALAKAAGAFVIGTSRTPDKLERARAHGLDAAVVLEDGWPARVHAATNGRGADVVLDFVGAPILNANVAALAGGGRIVQIGTLGGAQASLFLGALMAKRGTLIGTVLRTRPLDEKIALARAFATDVLPLVARGIVRTEIDSVFALADLADAHRRMEADANFGKILLRVAGE